MGIATRAPKVSLVLMKGEGRDSNDRDRFQTVTILQPPAHDQAGYVWQLDVHEDQIRTMLSSHSQAIRAIRRLQDSVSMQFE